MNKCKDRLSVIRFFSLTCLLFICCCNLLACQPTPETPPVVNRVEDVPLDAIKATLPPEVTAIEQEKEYLEAPAYTLLEHWSETIEKTDFLTIVADTDIYMPDISVFPVERLERFDLTQEKVNELIAFFTEPGTKFYTGDTVKLKSEYEDDLIHMKASLQHVLNGGDGETPESIRRLIEETEKLLVNAPESYTYTYVEPVFTYQTDYETGEPRTEFGENQISVSLEQPDGTQSGHIGASRYERDKTTSAAFSYAYYSGGYMTEYYLNWLRDEMNEQEANPPVWANDEWQRDIDRQRKYAEDGLKNMEANTLDKETAKAQAIALLKELNIKSLQVEAVDRIMIAAGRPSMNDTPAYTIPAIEISFTRECGGLPVTERGGGSFSNSVDYSELYCAPFSQESITVLVGADGVIGFSWGNIASPVERVAEDTEFLPLNDIKKRIMDHIFFMGNFPERHTDGSRTRAEISDLRLCAAYINAKDDPERVLVVPAWHATVREYYFYPDAGDKWWPGNHEEVLINALDGGAILIPAMYRHLAGM